VSEHLRQAGRIVGVEFLACERIEVRGVRYLSVALAAENHDRDPQHYSAHSYRPRQFRNLDTFRRIIRDEWGGTDNLTNADKTRFLALLHGHADIAGTRTYPTIEKDRP